MECNIFKLTKCTEPILDYLEIQNLKYTEWNFLESKAYLHVFLIFHTL